MYQPLEAGSLDKHVTIQAESRADDGGGGQEITLSDIGSWWVSVNTTGGREFRAAQQLQPELTHEIKGRFRPDVTAKHRLVYVSNNTTRIFNIHSVIDPMERHEQLVCFCSELTR